jgi:restriction system protein
MPWSGGYRERQAVVPSSVARSDAPCFRGRLDKQIRMSRRKQNQLVEPRAYFGLLVIVGLLFLCTYALQKLPPAAGGVLMLLILAAGAMAVGVLAFRLLRRAMARHSLFRKVEQSIGRHQAPLIRRRAQLVQQDAYGKIQVEKWNKEIGGFISNHIIPKLTQYERAALSRNGAEVANLVEYRVMAATRAQPAFQSFSDNLTPAEFEAFYAEQLRSAGWNARVTLQSRDQGVDVVAEKGGVRVVIQCKLYARPVGNKSVQEAAAARAHERAQYGVVVTNNRYTPAAEALAATNQVLLLHYSDLPNLGRLLSQKG